MEALEIGQTVEVGGARIHRFANSLRIIELEGAGKRGRRVRVLSVYDEICRNDASGVESLSNALVQAPTFDAMAALVADLDQYPGLSLQTYVERGVDVAPSGFAKIEEQLDHVSIRAEYDSFAIRDMTDKNNEPTAISMKASQAKKFYTWVSSRINDLRQLRYYQILQLMSEAGIRYHDYCAMD